MSEERRIDSSWPIILAHLWRGSASVNRGFKLFSLYEVSETPQAIIPDDENDVARGLWAAWTIYTSDDNFSSGTGQATPGGSDLELYNDGTNICALRVETEGNATIFFTNEDPLKADVTLLCLWQ